METNKEFNKNNNDIYPPFTWEELTPPGVEEEMKLEPKIIHEDYIGSKKLQNKTALVTGGDSGIGRAICVHFAREGADVAFTYLPGEKEDAKKLTKLIEEEGGRALAIEADFLKIENFEKILKQVKNEFAEIDVLVNNAAFQNHVDGLDELDFEQFQKTFEVNVFPIFKIIKQSMPYLSSKANIINTSSILGYVGDNELIDYSATKAAIRSMTKSLAKDLTDKNIRVNAVAPGPVWTPLNPAERDYEDMKDFGKETSFGRPAQPAEIAPAYVYLASEITGSFITGETINLFGDASGAN